MGQPLPTQNQPLIQSIQKQQPINIITTTQKPINPIQTQPLINTIQIQPIIDTIQNEQQHSEANIQYVPEYVPTTQRIVFPEDNEETSFPKFINTSPSNLESGIFNFGIN